MIGRPEIALVAIAPDQGRTTIQNDGTGTSIINAVRSPAAGNDGNRRQSSAPPLLHHVPAQSDQAMSATLRAKVERALGQAKRELSIHRLSMPDLD